MNDMIDWVERAGLENLRFRLQNSEALAKEASNLLMLLLGGMGATLAYVAKIAEAGSITAIGGGVAAVMLWLLGTALLLIWQCILTMPLQAPTNEPKNLFLPDFELEKIRRAELDNIQLRIDLAAKRNHHVAAWLDRVRILAAVSPLIFMLAAAAWAVH